MPINSTQFWSRSCRLHFRDLARPSCNLSQPDQDGRNPIIPTEKGTLRNLSLRSDGLLTLAPQFREVFGSSSAYLWALAQDYPASYLGGGTGAKLYRISPTGEKKTLAEFDAL
jgi:hypothetical protein